MVTSFLIPILHNFALSFLIRDMVFSKNQLLGLFMQVCINPFQLLSLLLPLLQFCFWLTCLYLYMFYINIYIFYIWYISMYLCLWVTKFFLKIYNCDLEAWGVIQWWNMCFASTRSWVQFPAKNKSKIVTCTNHPLPHTLCYFA